MGFDEIPEAVREIGTSPTEKAEPERKKSQSIYAHMLCVLSCVSLAGKTKLSLEVKMCVRDRERVLSLEVKMCVRERERERERVLSLEVKM